MRHVNSLHSSEPQRRKALGSATTRCATAPWPHLAAVASTLVSHSRSLQPAADAATISLSVLLPDSGAAAALPLTKLQPEQSGASAADDAVSGHCDRKCSRKHSNTCTRPSVQAYMQTGEIKPFYRGQSGPSHSSRSDTTSVWPSVAARYSSLSASPASPQYETSSSSFAAAAWPAESAACSAHRMAGGSTRNRSPATTSAWPFHAA